MKTTVAFVGSLLLAVAALAGQVRFTSRPTVAREGDKVAIRFAVSAPTDVEVAVRDAEGTVVRHLAAGVVGGGKAPPAPLRAGLSQTLEWDLRDDFGKPAEGGPFTVRVRASSTGSMKAMAPRKTSPG